MSNDWEVCVRPGAPEYSQISIRYYLPEDVRSTPAEWCEVIILAGVVADEVDDKRAIVEATLRCVDKISRWYPKGETNEQAHC